MYNSNTPYESQWYYCQLINNSPAAKWITDQNGYFHFINATYSTLFLKDSADVKGMHIRDIYPPAIADQYLKNNKETITRNEVLIAIEDGIYANGTVAKFLVQKFPLKDKNGETLIAGWAIDITDRLQIEEQVQFQSELLLNVQQAVVATDLEGNIIYWNKFAESLYGWTNEEAIGKNASMLVSLKDCDPELASKIFTNIMKGQSWSGEYMMNDKHGRVFPVYVTDSPVHNKDGEVIGAIGISHDISERREAEEKMKLALEKLSAQNEALRHIAFTQSHIVRRPLANILGLVQLLPKEELCNETLVILQMLQESAEDLDAIIMDIVDKATRQSLTSD